MFTPVSSRATSAYRKVEVAAHVDGASPHKLISMLYEAVLQALTAARLAMAAGNVAAKSEQLNRAVRYIEEGLVVSLDESKGGELAQNLRGVYSYCLARLTLANLRNDESLIREVIELIDPLAQAWNQIGQSVDKEPS